jgi:hypothetical protein
LKIAIEHHPDRRELLEFAAVNEHATFFHTPAWLKALSASFESFEQRWLSARSGGDLMGVMPFIEASRGPMRFFWALPFGTYGDPLAAEPSVSRELLRSFFDLARSARCLEVHANLLSFDLAEPGLARIGRVLRRECRMIHLGGGFETVWQHGFHHKRRQICNKGERGGVLVRPLETEGEVRVFYRTYREESRAWGGVHPYPERLFLELFRCRNEGVIIWGAFLGERFLGGHIDMYYGRFAQAWQAGMSPDSGQHGVDGLLVKYAVKEACERGMQLFNLGSSGGDAGIIYFKESLGGREYLFPAVSVRKRWWSWLRR